MFEFIQTPSPKDTPIVRPRHFNSTVMLKRFGLKVGVIVFTNRSFLHLRRLLKGKSLKFGPKAIRLGRIAVFLTNYGSAPSCLALEQMIAADIKRFIVFGEAGSINPRVRAGDVVVPLWGIREEGVSYHYLKGSVKVKPDCKVLRVLQEKLRRHGLEFKTGGIWSTDAPFMETIRKVRKYSSMGCLVVDMEMTALMAVAMRRGTSLAGVVVTTDELYTGIWNPRFDSDEVVSAEKRLAKAVVEASESLAET
ncbi:MAG: nucleoside phosphorylase [Candidatus Brockarchaeota archaeon]|nr:nucleoside phosphorylase [Candidatus Brockarchaeota archaeon]